MDTPWTSHPRKGQLQPGPTPRRTITALEVVVRDEVSTFCTVRPLADPSDRRRTSSNDSTMGIHAQRDSLRADERTAHANASAAAHGRNAVTLSEIGIGSASGIRGEFTAALSPTTNTVDWS